MYIIVYFYAENERMTQYNQSIYVYITFPSCFANLAI